MTKFKSKALIFFSSHNKQLEHLKQKINIKIAEINKLH